MKKSIRKMMLSFALATGFIPAIAIAQDNEQEEAAKLIVPAGDQVTYREFGNKTLDQLAKQLNEDTDNYLAQAMIKSMRNDNIYMCMAPRGPLKVDFAQAVDTNLRGINFGAEFYAMFLQSGEISPEDMDEEVAMCAKVSDKAALTQVVETTRAFNQNTIDQLRFYEYFAKDVIKKKTFKLELPPIKVEVPKVDVPKTDATPTPPPFIPKAPAGK